MASPLLTSREVAALLRVHPKHVYRLLRGGLPGKRAGGKWLFDRAEVLGWAEGRGGGAPRRASATAAAPERVPLVAANGDLAIQALLALACAQPAPLVGFVQADRGAAIRWLGDGSVSAAGCHGDEIPARVGEHPLVWLHLVNRQVGLATRRAPVAIEELARLRLASRPPTAGVRAHLDRALRSAGLSPLRVHRTATLYDSHQEVVSAVARGAADVGLCSHAWASRLGLTFTALAEEPYGILLRAAELGDAASVRLCEIAQSHAYRARLQAIPGYDATPAGLVRFSTDPPG